MPSTYYSMLSGRLPASVAYPLALLLAAGMVLYLYPSGFLAGQGAYFVTGDAASHISGWLFFREDQWRFPLLHSVRLNAPEGVSIAFTDSIPLVALLQKRCGGGEAYHAETTSCVRRPSCDSTAR